ncbi:MAG: DUF4270 family protein [Bacteroidetes bacterium]|nr:DUF4270 family protein [Bacteroidota bacterium]MBS1930878.1 DUF4270 family protein [Bacteroidota bacterium]
MLFSRKKIVFSFLLLLMITGVSCYRNDIEFGTTPANTYTKVVYIDTVEPRLSTVLLDSFITNSPISFLVGKIKDPYLGAISTKPFFQITMPSPLPSIPATAHYDSTCMIFYLNKYSYGDSTKPLTIQANELALPISYTYNTNLYNTSNVPEKPTPLGSRTLKIRPSIDDSFLVRVNDAKGLELFTKLQQSADELTSIDKFLNYFKGISLSVNTNDTSVVYGLNSATGKIIMRVYYHLATPVFQRAVADFTSLNNTYAFNQIITDRTNTSLYSATPGNKEFPSENTNQLAFTQYGAGVLLKTTFPTLKGILQSNAIVKLLNAELIYKPEAHSYDDFLKLPPSLILTQTDATNNIGASVNDSTGTALLNVSPVIDNIYGVNTYYRFNITSYINTLLTTPGSEKSGFFLMESGDPTVQLNRAVIGNAHSNSKTQLQLTVAVVNN